MSVWDELRRMSRADRLANRRGTGQLCNDGMPHGWLPVSFVFESQLLDSDGRVIVRQPGIYDGRVCLGCRSHTYVVTEWVGYYLGDPGKMADEPEDGAEQARRRHRAMLGKLAGVRRARRVVRHG